MSLLCVSCLSEVPRLHQLPAPECGVESVYIGLFYICTHIYTFLSQVTFQKYTYITSLLCVLCVSYFTEVPTWHQLRAPERGVEFACIRSLSHLTF